ncbi:RING finger protein 215 isoform X2 [Lathamus discolor]|uniref:RING finger protein 215 isoform X2 n=1 Tax=Lathamus discolor TaxID=678569 RepID=UPI0032B7E2E9
MAPAPGRTLTPYPDRPLLSPSLIPAPAPLLVSLSGAPRRRSAPTVLRVGRGRCGALRGGAMAAVRAALLAPLLALCRAGPGPAPAARVEVAVAGPGPGHGAGSAAAGPGGSYTLRGAVLGAGDEREREEIRGRLLLVGDAEPEPGAAGSWIGVVPVGEEPAELPRGAREESFTTAVVSKMKRALVLGASALLILALNQNAIRELDVSQLLAKPVIVIQSSDNVTRLLGALLRGLRATAKITYQAVLLENLGVTLTLWSTCGLSRGGLYGEWQGVICTGENSSQVQKYLQQLWNTILLIALLLCTGVIVQAQRQSRQDPSERDAELDLKQLIHRRLSALKTRRYHPGKALRSRACEIDSCAVCLDQFHKSQWLRVLPCCHEFHRDCVDPWLLLQQTCPLCKRNILGNCCPES